MDVISEKDIESLEDEEIQNDQTQMQFELSSDDMNSNVTVDMK
jgi:hypothetical protein